jgi:hypothetical protein
MSRTWVYHLFRFVVIARHGGYANRQDMTPANRQGCTSTLILFHLDIIPCIRTLMDILEIRSHDIIHSKPSGLTITEAGKPHHMKFNDRKHDRTLTNYAE